MSMKRDMVPAPSVINDCDGGCPAVVVCRQTEWTESTCEETQQRRRRHEAKERCKGEERALLGDSARRRQYFWRLGIAGRARQGGWHPAGRLAPASRIFGHDADRQHILPFAGPAAKACWLSNTHRANLSTNKTGCRPRYRCCHRRVVFEALSAELSLDGNQARPRVAVRRPAA